jgi:CubicO group peptidase (beta-lactamase class C family)
MVQRLIWLVAAGLLLPVLRTPAAAGFEAAECARVLQQGIADRAFPGCTVVVGTEKRVLWSAAFGHHDYSQQRKVTRAALYDLASVTKVAGTTAVFMRLVALEKVNLSDPVSKYLPEFVAAAPTPEERAQRERITTEHLLTHSAGLASWKPFYKTAHGYDAMLKANCATLLESAPGERFRYSDCGMMLAGEVAARAGGRPLPELEREVVFDPLRMKDTLRCPPEKLAARIPPTEVEAATGKAVQGVVHDENARAAGGITGHAGLFATAEDLGKLAQELLRALDGRSKLFPREVVEDFFIGRAIGKNSVRGVGWGIVRGAPGQLARVISHNGFTGTYLQLDLEHKRFVVLLTNRVHPTRDNDKLGWVRREFLDAVQRQFAPPPVP